MAQPVVTTHAGYSETAWQGLLAPRHIALVGASPSSEFYDCVMWNVRHLDYTGQLLPVNPSRTEVFGLPCVSRVSDIGRPVDLVVISVAARLVETVLEDALAAGCRSFVLYSSGYAETGIDGRVRQARLRELCSAVGAVLIGPNGLGFMSTRNSVPAFGAQLVGMDPGPIGLISHSGSVAITLLHSGRDLKFSMVASGGNEAVVSTEDMMEVMLADEATEIIALYLENLADGRRFRRLMEQAHDASKPVIALLGGWSPAGGRVVATHTGRLAADQRVIRAALADLGVAVAETPDDMAEMLDLAVRARHRKPGNRVGLIALSGGELSIAADIADRVGLDVPSVHADTAERIRGDLGMPAAATVTNPLDVAGMPGADAEGALASRYKSVVGAFAADPALDAVVIVQDGQAVLADELIDWYLGVADGVEQSGALDGDKLVAVVSPMSGNVHPTWKNAWNRLGVPVLRGLEPALRAIHGVAQTVDGVTRVRPGLPDSTTVDGWLAALGADSRQPDERDARALLDAYGVPLVESSFCADAAAAVAAARSLGGMVAMKIVSRDILHKSDIGGVALGLNGDDQVRAAFDLMMRRCTDAQPDAKIDGVLVAPQVDIRTELIVGAINDATFGPMVMLGLGGVFVEAIDDVAFGLAPITDEAALALIDRLRLRRILDGFRGHPPIDRKALASVVIALGDIVSDSSRVSSIEINPLAFDGRQLTAIDARVVLTSPSNADDGEAE